MFLLKEILILRDKILNWVSLWEDVGLIYSFIDLNINR